MVQPSLGPGRVTLLLWLRYGPDDELGVDDLMVMKMKHISALPFKAKLDVDACVSVVAAKIVTASGPKQQPHQPKTAGHQQISPANCQSHLHSCC